MEGGHLEAARPAGPVGGVGAPPGRGGTQAECTGYGGQGDPPTHRPSSHSGSTLGPHTGSLSPEAPVPVQATEAKQRCVTSGGMAPSGQRARPRGKPCQPMASSPWKDRSRMEARQARSRRGLEREAEEDGAWRGPGPRGLQGHGPELKRNSLQLEGRGGRRRPSLGWSPQALQEPREEEASRECQTARERRQAGGGMGSRHDSGRRGQALQGGMTNVHVQQTGPLKQCQEAGWKLDFGGLRGERGGKTDKAIRPCFFRVWRSVEEKKRSCCKMVDTEACPLLLEQRIQAEEAAGEGCRRDSSAGWGGKGSGAGREGGAPAAGSGRVATRKAPDVGPTPGLLTRNPSPPCWPQKDYSEDPVK